MPALFAHLAAGVELPVAPALRWAMAILVVPGMQRSKATRADRFIEVFAEKLQRPAGAGLI